MILHNHHTCLYLHYFTAITAHEEPKLRLILENADCRALGTERRVSRCVLRNE